MAYVEFAIDPRSVEARLESGTLTAELESGIQGAMNDHSVAWYENIEACCSDSDQMKPSQTEKFRKRILNHFATNLGLERVQ